MDKNEVNKSKQSEKNAQTEKEKVWSALSLAWQLGYTIAIPLVVLALTGRILDKRFNTSPWLLLVGIFLSIIISTFAVYYKTIKILSETERENKKQGTNNK
jgi:F0F1-type ATP synthase assembly protein I